MPTLEARTASAANSIQQVRHYQHDDKQADRTNAPARTHAPIQTATAANSSSRTMTMISRSCLISFYTGVRTIARSNDAVCKTAPLAALKMRLRSPAGVESATGSGL